jgi:hypothetical protein
MEKGDVLTLEDLRPMSVPAMIASYDSGPIINGVNPRPNGHLRMGMPPIPIRKSYGLLMSSDVRFINDTTEKN